MKSIKLFIALAAMAVVSHANAADVADVHGGDANIVNAVFAISDPVGLGRTGVGVMESYGEASLLADKLPGVHAIVSSSAQFFDLTLTITQSDQHTDWDSMYINLQVSNDTPYAWSGYRVEFFDERFAKPFGITLLNVNGTGLFGNSVFDQTTVNPFTGEYAFLSDSIVQLPGQTNDLWFRWDWGNPLEPYPVGHTIGIRQVATTVVPLPGAAWLMMTACVALGVWRPRRLHQGGLRT